ncbi:MAG: AraC family transcriptional regulator [Myxococcaceae bacterium]|nr:AraC family transcriptional regulator [Myxococcaceae bacterium]
MSRYLKLQDPVLPLQHPRVLIETAVEQGASRKGLLQDTGIEDAMLSDPDARISYSSFGALTVNALRLTANPALGIDFGKRVRFTNLGMTGLAVAASATVEQALRTQLRFGAIFAPAWDCTLRTNGRRATVSATPVLPFGKLRAFGAEALFAAIIETALGSETTLHELRFDYDAPAHAARYLELGQAAVRFGQSAIELVFDAGALARALPTYDPITRALAIRQCEADLARLPGRKRLVSTVRGLIDAGGGEYATHDAVASALGMNPRALRRALKDLGTSYQVLLDELRRANALRYLRASAGPLEHAAEQLGFSDVRSLRRSVRRWTGMSLQELRKRARGGPPLH